eukprot:9961091-Karenia_brevis.AAC.1
MKKEESVKSSSEVRYPGNWGAFMVHAGGNALTPWRWHSRLHRPVDQHQWTRTPGEHSWSPGRRRHHMGLWQWEWSNC